MNILIASIFKHESEPRILILQYLNNDLMLYFDQNVILGLPEIKSLINQYLCGETKMHCLINDIFPSVWFNRCDDMKDSKVQIYEMRSRNLQYNVMRGRNQWNFKNAIDRRYRLIYVRMRIEFIRNEWEIENLNVIPNLWSYAERLINYVEGMVGTTLSSHMLPWESLSIRM